MSTPQVLDAVERATTPLAEPANEPANAPAPIREMPRQIRKAIALRAMGFTPADIAKRLNIKLHSVYCLFYRARTKYGWDDLGDQLANVALPQAVDNIVAHLKHEGTKDAIENGQSLMTRTFASGVGVFKSHSAVKSTSQNENLNVMRIEILGLPTLPEGGSAGPVAGVLAAPRRAVPSGAGALPPAPQPPIIDAEVVK